MWAKLASRQNTSKINIAFNALKISSHSSAEKLALYAHPNGTWVKVKLIQKGGLRYSTQLLGDDTTFLVVIQRGSESLIVVPRELIHEFNSELLSEDHDVPSQNPIEPVMVDNMNSLKFSIVNGRVVHNRISSATCLQCNDPGPRLNVYGSVVGESHDAFLSQ